MNNIEKLFGDTFCLSEQMKQQDDFSLISLHAALKSFFSTFECIGSNLANLEDDPKYYVKYIESFMESIIHVHHFFELSIKRILRDNHELLSLNISDKHEILFDLMHGKKIDESILSGLSTPEFNLSLDRLCSLIRSNKIVSPQGKLILDNKTLFCKLNNIRNRIWHRGTIALHYKSLDEIFGKYLLEIIIVMTELYKPGNEIYWKYKPLHCGIDPIQEIIKEYTKKSTNCYKMAIIKEMARAAYNNPCLVDSDKYRLPLFIRNDRLSKHIVEVNNREIGERYASLKPEQYGACDIKTCPVCGINSFLIKDDYVDGVEHDTDRSIYLHIIVEVSCLCCGFKLGSDIGYSNHELKFIEDLFDVHERERHNPVKP